jgi:hypothetical protein
MRKRPQIKGKGADIYLGGDPQERPAPRQSPASQQKEPIEAKSSEKQSEGKAPDSVSRFGESFLSLDGVRKTAARYIECGEKLANQAIELQEKTTSWAKKTPLWPLFEVQTTIARKIVESSASAARNLWQIRSHEQGA